MAPRDGDELARTLDRIDGRGYRAYKDIAGAYAFPEHTLFVDHVQGDPFAAPSKLRVRVPMSVAALPAELFAGRVRRMALADHLARRVRVAVEQEAASSRGRGQAKAGERHVRGQRGGRGAGSGSGKSGLIAIDAGAQQVLERTAVRLEPDFVEARVEVGLPANGRRVLGRQARSLLTRALPEAVLAGLCWTDEDADHARRFVECVENQEHIRARLPELGLLAFVGDGSLLPRESGASDRPLPATAAVPFASPPSLAVEIELPNPVRDGGEERVARGMGIAQGVTLVVGGGYHGKSTLLRAIQRAVHPHVPGDGRELVVSDPSLVKIRAEDGRRVERVDIHAFIGELPAPFQLPAPHQLAAPDQLPALDQLPAASDERASTRAFSSEDASGSTSQAASIVEAIEAGASGLLLDEDTSATNFMVRDARMQALVHKEHEPITPFVDRVRELYETLGVSTVLVMGGSGDYFDVADRVIMMRDYRALEVSAETRRIAGEHPTQRQSEVAEPMRAPVPRVPLAGSFDPSRGRREVKIDVKERDRILYGREPIDLRGVEQVFDWSQTRAIGWALHLATKRFMRDGATVPELLDALDALIDEHGLDVLDPFERGGGAHPGNLARPRRFEIAAAMNRLRTLRVRAPDER